MFSHDDEAESDDAQCSLISTSHRRDKDANVQPCLLTTDSNRTSTGTDELVSSPGSELTASGSHALLRSGQDSWCAQERSLHDGDFLDEADLKWLCGYNQTQRSDGIPENTEYMCSSSSRSPYYIDTTVANVDMDSFYREDMNQFLTVSDTSCQIKDASLRLFQSGNDVSVSMNLSADSLDSLLMEPDKIAQSCCPNRKNYTIAFSGSIHNDSTAPSVWMPSSNTSSSSFVQYRLEKASDSKEWRQCMEARMTPVNMKDFNNIKERTTKSFQQQDITKHQQEIMSTNFCEKQKTDKCQQMKGNLVEKFLNQRLSQNKEDNANQKGIETEDDSRARTERHLINWTDCPEKNDLAPHVGVKFRSSRGRPQSLAEGNLERIPANHRLSMPLVDNGMQTSSNESNDEIDTNRVLYIYYPQYSMPNLQFLSETLDTARDNIALCPTPLCASKPLPACADSNVRHRPLSCNDGESLRKQQLEKVTDWPTLWPLLPESVHTLLKSWNLPIETFPHQHARLLTKINPTKFVNKYEIIQENASNSYGSSLKRSDSSGNDSLKDWLDKKMQTMIASNQTMLPKAHERNVIKTNIVNANVKNLLMLDGDNIQKHEKQKSGKMSKIRVAKRLEDETIASVRKAERKYSQPSPSRHCFAGLTGPVYETIINIENDSLRKLTDGKLDVDSVQLLKLCSCLHALLVHGMKADLQTHTRVPFTAAWLLIEAMTSEIKGHPQMKMFVDRLNSDCVLQDHTFKYCAFMSHLAESHHLVDFLSALSSCRGVVRRFYTGDAFMFQSSWAASSEFSKLLQRLSNLRVRHVRSREQVSIQYSKKATSSVSCNNPNSRLENSSIPKSNKQVKEHYLKKSDAPSGKFADTVEVLRNPNPHACASIKESLKCSSGEKISRRNSDIYRVRTRLQTSKIPRPVSDGCTYATTLFNVK